MSIGGIVSGIGGALGLAGTLAGSSAQQSGDAQDLALQKQQLAQEQSNAAPYLETGSGALGQLSQLYGIATPSTAAGGASGAGFAANTGGTGSGGFTNPAAGRSTVNPDASFYLSPDYNFALTQGLKGLTAQGAAASGTNNGEQIKDEIQYAGGLASSQYDNYKQGLLSLAGLGSQASSSLNSTSAATAANAGDVAATGGNQLASSYLGLGTEAGKLASSLGSSFAGTSTGAAVNTYLGGL